MNRKQRIIISITGITIVLLALVGLTYGYFLTIVRGNSKEKSVSAITNRLSIVYKDGISDLITSNDLIEPGKFKSQMDFTVSNNGKGTVEDYAVVLENFAVLYASDDILYDEENNPVQVNEGDMTSLVHHEDMKLTITCESNVAGKTCNGLNDSLPQTDDILVINTIEKDEIQTYSVTLEYIDNGNQSEDMNKTIEGKINIIDTKDTIDITGEIENYVEGDYVQINSTEKISKIHYIDGKHIYKILGLELGEHRVRVFDKTGTSPKLDTKISIEKGEEASVNGTTITITDLARTLTSNISSNGLELINSKITLVNPYSRGTLAYQILENGAQVLNVNENKLEIDKTYEEKTQISNVSDGTDMTDVGIFTAEDDYGTSYYFRGPVKNNYVNFAGFTWRIVRINGDGSVRLILDGALDKTCVEYQSDGQTCATYAATRSAFNSVSNNNAYVGYMYGLALSDTESGEKNRCLRLNGTTVTDYISTYITKEACEKNGGKWTTTAYEATHANVKDSTIKSNVDKFYETYIENGTTKQYEKYLSDTMFCGDKSLAETGIGGVSTQLGYGTSKTMYAAMGRLWYHNGTTSIASAKTLANPTLKCAENETNTYSRYSVGIYTINGVKTNGDLKHPIALLSADEQVLAGAFVGTSNSNYYLDDVYNNDKTYYCWWLITPAILDSNMRIFDTYTDSKASLTYGTGSGKYEIRPVINLSSEVLVESGNGTSGTGAYKVRLAS